jgi:hypothetical protein
MAMLSRLTGCITLSVEIVDYLLISKGNKDEYRSLKSALQNFYWFLDALPNDSRCLQVRVK